MHRIVQPKVIIIELTESTNFWIVMIIMSSRVMFLKESWIIFDLPSRINGNFRPKINGLTMFAWRVRIVSYWSADWFKVVISASRFVVVIKFICVFHYFWLLAEYTWHCVHLESVFHPKRFNFSWWKTCRSLRFGIKFGRRNVERWLASDQVVVNMSYTKYFTLRWFNSRRLSFRHRNPLTSSERIRFFCQMGWESQRWFVIMRWVIRKTL